MPADPDRPGIHVTAHDPQTGESSTEVIWDDYVITCAGSAYVDSISTYPSGTHVITVKGRADRSTTTSHLKYVGPTSESGGAG